MNYRYLIALFAGEEVDSWTAPKSEWMHIQSIDSTDWSDEFKKLKGLTKRKDFTPKYVSCFMRQGIETYTSYGDFSWDRGFECYYEPEKDWVFFYSDSNDANYLNKAGGIEKVLDFLSAHDDMQGREVIAYEEVVT